MLKHTSLTNHAGSRSLVPGGGGAAASSATAASITSSKGTGSGSTIAGDNDVKTTVRLS